jgi:1-acyl-sn-glycerol-3-phosphate acyltransferase
MAQVWAARVLAALHVQVALERPLPAGGQLWVSNHLSWLDPLVYLSLRPCRILAKAEVAGYPALGGGARRIGLRFVRRECPFSRAAALRTLGRDLAAGDAFLLFPEATTTAGDRLAPFQEGGLRWAYRRGITVLPLRLDCDDPGYPWLGDAELLPHLQDLARTRSTRVAIRPGPVLEPGGWRDEAGWLRAIHTHLERSA